MDFKLVQIFVCNIIWFSIYIKTSGVSYRVSNIVSSKTVTIFNQNSDLTWCVWIIDISFYNCCTAWCSTWARATNISTFKNPFKNIKKIWIINRKGDGWANRRKIIITYESIKNLSTVVFFWNFRVDLYSKIFMSWCFCRNYTTSSVKDKRMSLTKTDVPII